MKTLLCIVTLLVTSQIASAQWVKQTVNTSASFRGLSVVNEKIIWASGTEGTVIRTIDGGKTWNVMTVPGAGKLDFRDIEAFDANTAYILSIGNGESSRIYKTADGGKSWKEQFRNKNEKAFFDAMTCWGPDNCIAVSDPVEGKFLLISIRGAEGWQVDDYTDGYMPDAKPGEAAFAASGTCIVRPDTNLFLVVTGGSAARVFRSQTTIDTGIRWRVFETGLLSGSPGSGIFSIAMYDRNRGVIVGGNYEKAAEHINNLGFTYDSGITWNLGTGLSGYRSGVTYLDKKTIIAVGTNGTDITRDGGKSWNKVGNEDLNAVAAKGKRAVWAVGPKGVVVKMK
jgi:photosystem II stability/assembly factor-like uncharacterized protein